MKPLLSVIIVSYNTKELTIQTLSSVEKEVQSSPLLKSNTNIFVVDNNSSDDSVAALTAFKKKATLPVTILANTTNKGFGAANNQAVAQSKAKYVVFLNSDTIVNKGGLSEVIKAFETTKNPELTSELSSEKNTLDNLGIMAATLLNSDGSIQPQGGSTPTLGALFSHLLFLDDIPVLGTLFPSTQHTGRSRKTQKLATTSQELIPIDWVGGTALFIKKEVLDQIGAFDEKIFMYAEDIELCMRAQQHHYDVAIHPTATITHLQNMSSSSKNAIIGELLGYKYIWAKHKPLWQRDLALFILSLGALIRYTIFDTIGRDRKKAAAYKEALQKLRHK